MAREHKGQPFDTGARSSDFSYQPDDSPPRKEGNLFAWTVAILLLIGFAIFCWVFSFYVFGHPEKPFSYAILTKLKKLDAPKRFEITAAPQGEFLNAQQLWERYNKMTNRELERASEGLLRNYLRNYKLTGDKAPYIIGSYNILDSYELGNSNLFSSGVVAVAQATDAPQVLLEHVFTADKRVIPILHRMLLTGLNLRFDKAVDLSAVVNVKRLKDGRLQVTAIPLLYGSYATSTGAGTFSLEPPASLNVAARLPVVNPALVEEATEKLNAYRGRAGLGGGEATSATPRPQMQLVRVERPKPASDSAVPPAPVASPPPPPVEEPTVLPAIPVKAPPSTPAVANATPPSSFRCQAHGHAAPAFHLAHTGLHRHHCGWKLADVCARTDAPRKARQRARHARVGRPGSRRRTDLPSGKLYRHRFRPGPCRASLASSTSGESRYRGPQQQHPDHRGISFRKPTAFRGRDPSRDSRRPFLVTEVRKTSDGQVNVYVREVTRAQ